MTCLTARCRGDRPGREIRGMDLDAMKHVLDQAGQLVDPRRTIGVDALDPDRRRRLRGCKQQAGRIALQKAEVGLQKLRHLLASRWESADRCPATPATATCRRRRFRSR